MYNETRLKPYVFILITFRRNMIFYRRNEGERIVTLAVSMKIYYTTTTTYGDAILDISFAKYGAILNFHTRCLLSVKIFDESKVHV